MSIPISDHLNNGLTFALLAHLALLGLALLARLADESVGPVVTADAAVVAGEDEDGVFAELEFVEFGHDAEPGWKTGRESNIGGQMR